MELDAEIVSVLRSIVESIRRTAEYGSDIAEVVLSLPSITLRTQYTDNCRINIYKALDLITDE